MAATDSAATKLVEKLAKVLADVSADPDVEAVHGLRTTSRRLETALHAAATGDGPHRSRLLKQLKALRRRAGEIRDIDVQMALLEALRVACSDEQKAVLAAMAALRKKKAKKLGRAVEEQVGDGLEKRLGKAAAGCACGTADDPRNFLDLARAKFLAAVEQFPQLTAANLHAFRMECKRARYLAELAGEAPAARRLATQFKRVQDAVGTWHDWSNLVATVENLAPTKCLELSAAVERKHRTALSQALRVANDAKRDLGARVAGPNARKSTRSSRSKNATASVRRTAR